MALELRHDKKTGLRPHWYGRYEAGGKRYCLNLGVKIAGTPPTSLSLKDEGDTAYERSRATAQAKLDAVIEEAKSRTGSERIAEKLYEMKTGESVKSVRLADMPAQWLSWLKADRTEMPGERYINQCQGILQQFVDYVGKHHSKATEMVNVTRRMARAFMDSETARGVSPKTWNDSLMLLRSVFRHLLPPGAVNPFGDMRSKEKETVYRKPFNPEELKAILEATENDLFCKPIIVTAMCTALRRGDCCLLRWSDVDLNGRFLTVKTAKTGETVAIPIFPPLLKLLLSLKRTSEYAFPAQAKMYNENPDGITIRIRRVLAAAGFKDADTETADDEKKEPAENKPAFRGDIHATRKTGIRRASIRDFHSFRVTWVTLALTAKVPMELVQRVTGHRTVDIVLRHYFQPDREDFRRALESAMPHLLTEGKKSPLNEVRAIVDRLTAANLLKSKARLQELLAQM